MVTDFSVDAPYKRVDIYLSQKLNLSRSQIQKFIENGYIKLNGNFPKPSNSVKAGDLVSVNIPEEPEFSQLEAICMPLNILYEDEYIIVLSKEKGIVVHPANGHRNDTLVNAILGHCQDLKGVGGVLRPGVVHRLDKDTAGVMVFAKDDVSYKELQRQFKEREVKKRYLALVLGKLKTHQGTIVTKIGRKEKDRIKFSVKQEGKDAITEYRVLQEGAGISLVEVFIKTGRTHQIRVHMEYIGNPIIGDPFYNKKQYKDFIKDSDLLKLATEVKGQALFAEYLEFKHPITGKIMGFHGIMPDDMKNIIERLNAVSK